MSLSARIIDELLEATVVGSFSRIGYDARSRLDHWTPPPALTGQHVVVTGASAGLGFETAAQLGASGATVTFLARDGARAEMARSAIVERAGHDDIDFELTDLSDLSSVRRTAEALHDEGRPIDVLIHNAGALTRRYEETSEGTERTVATHVLGPFLLTTLLLPLMRQASLERRAAPARVITVSSGGMYTQRFDLARLEMSGQDYDGVTAYARAKRAQLVLIHAWSRRIDPRTIVFHAMHPGWADTPGVASSLPGFHRIMGPLLRTPAQGADTIVWLATATEPERTSGQFWLDRRCRWEHKLPWTLSANRRLDQERLWRWCTDRVAVE